MIQHKDNFMSIRSFAISVLDYAHHIRDAAESDNAEGEEMTAEKYAWYLGQISELTQRLGNLAYVTGQVRRNTIEQERVHEEAADEARLNEELDLVLNVK